MDPYNNQGMGSDPNGSGQAGYPTQYMPPQFDGQPYNPPDSDEEAEFDEERLMQAERELSDDAPWKKIQQNTFTRWVNEKLKAANDPSLLVQNLQTDFKDGIRLARLVEVLADKKIPGITKKARIQIQQLGNITAVLDFLKREHIDLVTIDSSHINGGNMKLILALIWALILHYSIALARWNDEDDLEQSKSGRERLLKWMENYVTGHYAGPKINNFNKDWNDGTKLGALVDSKAPGLCPEWDEWNPANAFENANTAMDLAQNYLDIPKLIAPEEIVSPSVDDKAVMTYLSQFPRAKAKPDVPLKPFCKPKRAKAHGPGVEPYGCVANQETHFTIDTYGAGQGTAEVSVSDPNSQNVPAQVVFNNDQYKTYRVTYTPIAAGVHKVEVKWSGMPIRDSPFSVNVSGIMGDASKCRAAGPGLAVNGIIAGQPTWFEIFTENAGSGAVDCLITDPTGRGETVQMRIDREAPPQQEKYTVRYLASVGGAHSIKVTFNGRHVPGSAFTVNIQGPAPGESNVPTTPRGDARRVVVTGRGVQPKGLRVGEPAVFTCHTKEAGEGELTLSVFGPGGVQLPCSKQPRGDGEFECVYNPTQPGPYKVIVHFAGTDVPRSPFQVMVGKPSTSRVIAFGPGLFGGQVGVAAAFTVDTCGEPDANLGFSIEGPQEAHIEADDNRDGSCRAKYYPLVPGDYIIHITCNGEDIKDSPFNARILPAQGLDTSQIKVTGPGVQPQGNSVNKPTDVYISAPGFPPNAELSVLVVDKDGEYLQTSPVQPLEPGRYSVQYCPYKDQKHTIYVCANGVAVAESPYQVVVDRGYDLSNVTVKNLQPGKLGGHQGKPTPSDQKQSSNPEGPVVVKYLAAHGDVFVEGYHDFVVDARAQPNHVGNEEVKVVIVAPSGKKTAAKVRPNGDATYEVGYVLKEVGPHNLEVSYQGAQIPNSPFRVNATKGRDAKRVQAVGPGLTEGIVGQEALFTVISKNAGPGSLGVYIEGPSEAKTTFKDNKDGTCSLAYLPTKPGDYNITIKYEDEFIQDSPFRARIYNNAEELRNKPEPARVRVSGPCISADSVLASEPQEIFVDASQAGQAPLHCAITDPMKRELPTQVRDNRNGTFNVQWVPEDLGPHMINMVYGDQQVADSPYHVTSQPTGNALAAIAPEIPTYIPVNREFPFTVDASKAGRGNITCSADGPDGRRYPVLVQARPGGMFDCRFLPNLPGNYQLNIKFGGNHVKGSPFTVFATDDPSIVEDQIDPAFANPNYQAGNQPRGKPFSPLGPNNQHPGQLPLGSPQGGYPGSPNQGYPGQGAKSGFPGPGGPGSAPGGTPGSRVPVPEPGQLTPCDIRIATEPPMPGQPAAHVTGEVIMPSRQTAVPMIRANGDGTVAVKFSPSELGKHQLNLRVNGQEVKGSPFYFNVDVISEGRVSAYGPGLTSGIVHQPCQFTVATKAHGGPGGLKVSVQGPSRVEVQCADNGDGTCQCQFTPTVAGDYVIEVQFDDKPVQGSPFTSRIQDPYSAVKQTYIPMGSESRVTLKISEPDISVLTSTIKPPNGPEEPCKLMRMSNGSIGVSFTPREVGEHLVNVFKEGQHIPNSPFKISVSPAEIGDASKVRVWGPGISRAAANEMARFNIDMSDAGYSNLSLSMEGPSQANLDCSDTENGQCEVTYMPTEPGEYTLNIRYGDKHVPGSPFQVSVTGEGLGLSYTERTSKTRHSESNLADIGNTCELALTIPGANTSDMRAQVISPSGQIEPANLASDGRHKFQVSFVPEEYGIHQVHVFNRDREIQGSPFQFTVGPLQDQGAAAVKAYGPGLQHAEANQPSEFVILTREAGGGSLSVAVEGPAKTDIELEDNKDGSCNILYYPTLPGEYQVNVKFNDQHIPSSPFRVVAVPGPSSVFPQPDTGLVPEQPASFVVGLPNVFNAREIESRLVGPSGREAPCSAHKLDSQGNYAVKFTPIENGENRVEVQVRGAHIPGSPFFFKVGQTKGDATRVFADGEGLFRGQTGHPCEFVVNTCNAGRGTLQVTVDGPSRVTMDCKEVDEGYSVRYVAHVPGEYIITIKYAGPYHINGSPFKAVITGSAVAGYVTDEQIMQQEIVTVDTVAKTRFSSSDQAVPQTGGNDGSKVIPRGAGLKRAQCNMFNSFQVDASNAGRGLILVGCQGPTLPADEIVIKHMGKQRYDVRFKPAQPGDHFLIIKWGDQHVMGSPFHVVVT